MASIRIFCAGSFRLALQDLLACFQTKRPIAIDYQCGPAGILREQIELGEACDIFISANRQNIEELGSQVKAKQLIAHNTLLLSTLNKSEYQRTSLDLLFDETLRLATSTPGCDPSGDYTWQLFDLIEKQLPTQGEKLKARALQLVGGKKSQVVIPQTELAASYLLKNNYAEMMLGYGHYRLRLQEQGLLCHDLPEKLQIRVEYMAARLTEKTDVVRLFYFLISKAALEIIQRHGFLMI